MRRGPILVVSAFLPELLPLRRILKKSAASGSSNSQVVCLPVGIGAVDAAIGAALAIERLAPRLVLFVGTAGSYGIEPPIGNVVVARRISLASTAVARGDGYLPAPMSVSARITADPGLGRRLSDGSGRRTVGVRRDGHAAVAPTPISTAAANGLAFADVACPIAITRTTTLAGRLARMTGASVENLEAFAVGRSAAGAGIPFGAVLGISNRVGPDAHIEWRQHQARATLAVARSVAKFLAADLRAPSRSVSQTRRPRA